MSQEYSFKLSFEDFDIDLIGFSIRQSDSAEFGAKATEFVAQQFKSFGGRACVVINDQDREIELCWTKDANWSDPKDSILNLLNCEEFAKAVPMIWRLIKNAQPDMDKYRNLGVVYSELKQLPKVIATLEQVLDIYPNHVLVLIALGVAQIRTGNLQFGEESLRRALSLEPLNRLALRNLGSCLMKQQRQVEAIDVLRRYLSVSPDDARALIELGDAFEQSGNVEEANGQYLKAIQLGGQKDILDMAKTRRTKLA